MNDIKRRELLLSLDFLETYDDDSKIMNRGKVGRVKLRNRKQQERTCGVKP